MALELSQSPLLPPRLKTNISKELYGWWVGFVLSNLYSFEHFIYTPFTAKPDSPHHQTALNSLFKQPPPWTTSLRIVLQPSSIFMSCWYGTPPVAGCWCQFWIPGEESGYFHWLTWWLEGISRGLNVFTVVSAIAAVELPQGQWPDLFEILPGFVNNQNNTNLKISTLQTIGFTH